MNRTRWWLLRRNFFGMAAIAKKDIKLYYVKGPVIVFGLLFPFFLFLAFSLGRNLSAEMFTAPMLSMAVFFTSASVGPIIAPWETRMRTLEKLLTTPVSVPAMIIGDVVAGLIFGFIISLVALVGTVLTLHVSVNMPLGLAASMLVGCFAFSSLGILLSSPPTDNPSDVMMLSNLVKLPLIFVSGVFVPLSQMSVLGRSMAMFSPLTYFADVATGALGGTSVHSVVFDLTFLLAFGMVFLVLAAVLHDKSMSKRF